MDQYQDLWKSQDRDIGSKADGLAYLMEARILTDDPLAVASV